MAFRKDEITPFATTTNQHNENAISFASQFVQLQKLASLSSSKILAQLIQKNN